MTSHEHCGYSVICSMACSGKENNRGLYYWSFVLGKLLCDKPLSKSMITQISDVIYINGLVQDCSISIANALEILQSRTEPSICGNLLRGDEFTHRASSGIILPKLRIMHGKKPHLLMGQPWDVIVIIWEKAVLWILGWYWLEYGRVCVDP